MNKNEFFIKIYSIILKLSLIVINLDFYIIILRLFHLFFHSIYWQIHFKDK